MAVVKSSFSEAAWKNLKFKTVAVELLAEGKAFRGYRECLFAGLMMRTLRPKGRGYVQSALALEAIRVMTIAERKIFSLHPDRRVPGLAVDMIENAEFYEGIYFPLGGIRTFSRAPARQDLYKRVRDKSAGVYALVRLLRLHHYHAAHLKGDPSFRPASQEQATKILNLPDFHDRKGKSISPNSWRTYINRYGNAAAFQYAAGLVPTKDGSLLQDMFNGRAIARTHAHLLPQWLGITRYVIEDVLMNCFHDDLALRNAALLPQGIELVCPPPPAFTNRQDELFRQSYMNKRPVVLPPSKPL